MRSICESTRCAQSACVEETCFHPRVFYYFNRATARVRGNAQRFRVRTARRVQRRDPVCGNLRFFDFMREQRARGNAQHLQVDAVRSVCVCRGEKIEKNRTEYTINNMLLEKDLYDTIKKENKLSTITISTSKNI